MASGQPGPSSPPAVVKTLPSVSIGGQQATVTFAGMAPGFVGVYQVNAQVPKEITTGSEVPVFITQSSVRSNTVSVAVR